MQVGELVKMKGPKSKYSWRQGASDGIGIVITAAHRTARTSRGCTVLWSDKQGTRDIPEDWLEVIG